MGANLKTGQAEFIREPAAKASGGFQQGCGHPFSALIKCHSGRTDYPQRPGAWASLVVAPLQVAVRAKRQEALESPRPVRNYLSRMALN